MSPLLPILLARRLPWHTGDAVELTASMAVAVAVRQYALDARYIPTTSMEPTFMVGDHLLLDKVLPSLRPLQRGDVICFRPPPALAENTPPGSCFIKRVVGVAGDELQADASC